MKSAVEANENDPPNDDAGRAHRAKAAPKGKSVPKAKAAPKAKSAPKAKTAARGDIGGSAGRQSPEEVRPVNGAFNARPVEAPNNEVQTFSK